jgi:superfamily II DNA or RNA helicase
MQPYSLLAPSSCFRCLAKRETLYAVMDRIEITERFLMDTGGWQAMKHARALVEMGRVVSAAYHPPVLRGLVREGTTEYRAGLKILSKSNIENLCSCRDSREWGTICAHSLAVGLSFIRPKPVAAPVQPPPAPRDLKPVLKLDGAESRIIAHFILPPTFVNGWERNQVMIGCEVDTGGKRVLASALSLDHSYSCSQDDFQALEGLRTYTSGRLPGMLTLSRDQFLEALGHLVQHPRITLGRTTPVEVSSAGIKPRLKVEQMPDRRLRLTAEMPGQPFNLLVGGTSAWQWAGNQFQPIARGLPIAYFPLLKEPVILAADQSENFVLKELPSLAAFFEIEGHVEVKASEPGRAEIYGTFEGSLNHLTAKLQFLYGKRMVTFGATPAAETFVYELDSKSYSRNIGFEQSAASILREAGFQGPGAMGDFVLQGQNQILRFFAVLLPELQKKWKVSIGSRFQNVTQRLERITPKLDVVASGEDWFELSYSLESERGDRFSASDVQRLLQVGQGFTKLRDGTVAVFDPTKLEEFRNIIQDCYPTQTQPGRYRISRAQAGFIDGAARDLGATVGASQEWRQWTESQQQLKPLQTLPLGSLESVLRPYQKEGVYWLHFLAENRLGGILADEMGLGKTLQTLAFLRTVSGTSLIVCPASLLFNWRREVTRFVPELKVLSLEGPDRHDRFKELPRHNIALTSYPLLRRDVDLYREFHFGAVVLDEATHIKNPDTQNAQAAMALKANHRFVLTGTPVENSVRDLWSIMNFALPGYLGDRDEFRERYELPITRGSQPERERLAKRLRPVMLRRLKREVARDLPAKIEQVAFCDLTTEQRELYAKLQREGRQKVETLASEKKSGAARVAMLTVLLRLRQVCSDLRLLGETPEDRSGKLELLLELIEEAMDGGHRMLVFSQFVSMLRLIEEELKNERIDYCYLDGETRDRAAAVDRFQSSSDLPVFLISLKAGGTGLNLSAADTVLHVDPWWNPAVEDQATDRAHRIGQTKVVTSYKLITRGTVEEKILDLQKKKREIIDATVENEEPLMTGLSIEEIASLLEE